MYEVYTKAYPKETGLDLRPLGEATIVGISPARQASSNLFQVHCIQQLLPGRFSTGTEISLVKAVSRAPLMMADLSERRAAVKFCFLLRKNAAQTVQMLNTAYKDSDIGKTRVQKPNSSVVFSVQKRGKCRFMTNLNRRSSTSRMDENVRKFCVLLLKYRRWTI